MTILLRAMSVISAFLGVVCFFMPIMALLHGTVTARDAIASAGLIFLAVLAVRSTKWLWRKRRFWTEIKSLSEVAALGSLVLLWPLGAILEQQATGAGKTVVQVTLLLVATCVNFFIRHKGKKQTPVTIKP